MAAAITLGEGGAKVAVLGKETFSRQGMPYTCPYD